MSERLSVDVSALAAQQVRTAEAWWRANRPNAPGAIRDELTQATALIAAHPRIGTPAANVSLPGVRRLHLRRIHYDLYYRLVEQGPRIEILAFWHMRRGSRPPV